MIPPVPEPLYAVTAVSNPCRWQSRYRLYADFAAHVETSGVRLLTVEAAFGERPHAVTDAGDRWHLQVRGRDELWLKENLLNLGFARLCQLVPGWKYACWLDADVHFLRPDWARETVEQLQHYAVLQPWSEAHDLGPDGHARRAMISFGYAHVHGLQDLAKGTRQRHDYRAASARPVRGWHHPGLAWAFRREAWDALGGLFDTSIVGHADTIMALALLGHVDKAGMDGCSEGFLAGAREWQRRALRSVRQNVGYAAGGIVHNWHGPKARRQYGVRRRILVDTAYDPALHLARDAQGLYRLEDRGDPVSLQLRDRLRRFFRTRDEDSSSLT